MLRSIQWKLVIISFLLVWLAMAIVGVYITEAINKEQIDSMTSTIISRGYYLADNLKDKTIGAPNIQEIVDSWFVGQGKQVREVYIYMNDDIVASQKNYEGENVHGNLGLVTIQGAIEQRKEVVWPDENNEYLRSIAIPMISSDNEAVGAIYISADLSSVEQNVESIRKILTNATILHFVLRLFLVICFLKPLQGQ